MFKLFLILPRLTSLLNSIAEQMYIFCMEVEHSHLSCLFRKFVLVIKYAFTFLSTAYTIAQFKQPGYVLI